MLTNSIAVLAGSAAENCQGHSTEDRAQRQAILVSRLQGRDPLALAELYDQFGTRLYRVALRLVKDTATAEDLTQETFLHIWNGIGAFDAARGSLATWVHAVARNHALDYLRSAEFRTACRTAPWEHAGVPDSRAADGGLAHLERLSTLQGPWERLTPCGRRALRLAYYWGLSQPEIAARLNRPLGTVKTWIRRGLQSMRADLERADAS